MRKRILAIAAIGALLVVAATAAFGASTPERGRSASSSLLQPEELDGLRRVQDLRDMRAPKCTTVACFNKRDKQLNKTLNGLIAAHNSVVSFLNNCVRTVGVSQFDGYAYDGDGDGYSPSDLNDFETTALDGDDPALAQVRMMINIC